MTVKSSRIFDPSGIAIALPACLLLGAACALPLGWILLTLAGSEQVRAELSISSFRLALLGRTVLYGMLVAVLATTLAVPAALVLGRGPGWLRRMLWVVLPAGLLMPSLAYAYGWSQFVRLWREQFAAIGVVFDPAGFWDVVRCTWTLAGWLWPIPAILIGLGLARMDVGVQQQAAVDGALWRITLRQLAAPIAASVAVVTLLATQEFAVYEPTGISVIATEVRMVFETGAFSGMANPMTVPLGGQMTSDQAIRAAAAVATGLPLIVVTLMLAGVAAWLGVRTNAADQVAPAQWPRAMNAPVWADIAAVIVMVIMLVAPVWALVASLRRPLSPSTIWTEFAPELGGAMTVAGIVVVACLILALSMSARWIRGGMVVAGLSFLVGGQFLAIAAIRLWNRPGLQWVYDAFPVTVLLYLGRFGWLALIGAWGTWGKGWEELRAMAAVDGAGPVRTAMHVIWPVAWPMLLAGALLAGALSLTEVPATVLLQPSNPQVLTPMLMTWVHMTRYDPMIEASLLMMASVIVPWLVVVLLSAIGRRR